MRRELLLGLLVAWLAAPATDARAQQKKFEIAAIEAKLFYSNTGRFSSNIVGKPKFVLHNVVAGEGSAEGPSESTLLIVRLQGPPRGFLKELRLRVTARAEGDTLADHEFEVGAMNSAGNYYTACWLEDTGCQPIDVVAELRSGKERKQVQANIPFDCAE